MSIQSTTPITNLPEIAYLAVQALLGNIIIVIGSTGAVGTITSYTPAIGKRFMILSYHALNSPIRSIYSVGVDIRNNGTINDVILQYPITANSDTIKGDSLLGDGVKTYDMYLSVALPVGAVTSTMKGIIY